MTDPMSDATQGNLLDFIGGRAAPPRSPSRNEPHRPPPSHPKPVAATAEHSPDERAGLEERAAAWVRTRTNGPLAGFTLTRMHAYRDAAGKPLFWRARFDKPGAGKQIRPVKVDGDGFAFGEPPHSDEGKPLYRLDLLATRPAEPVYVVEGEKCADVLEGLGVLATTSGGAQSAGAADWRLLAGRDVTIWPDHDEPGAVYMRDVVKAIEGVGAGTVRVVDVDALGLPVKGDCFDWFELNPDAKAADVFGLACVEAAATVDTNEGATGAGSTVAPGFIVNAGGVFKLRDDGEPIRVCSELHVRGHTRNENGERWGRLLEWCDGDGRPHRWAMPMQLMAGDGLEVVKELLARGLRLERAGNTNARLFDFIANGGGDVRARCVNKLGWDGRVYVTPLESIGATDEEVVPQFEHAPAWAVAGTVDEWRETVARLARGNSRFVFAVSAAFAGPLAKMAGEAGGGFHLHGGSSCGKSTALHVAASVWGAPGSYARTWRATGNGLEGVAAMHNDGLLVLDELGESDPRETGETVYMLANGNGKTRANRAGGARATAAWRVLFLSAGEITLAAHMARAGKRPNAGQEVRFADVPADAGAGMGAVEALNGCADSGAFAKAIRDAATNAHGAVGVEWLRAVAGDFETAERDCAWHVKNFMAGAVPPGASGQVERVAKRFGLVAAAGELATQLGLTGWPEGEATRAARACFEAWLEGFGVEGNKEERTILDTVRGFFEAHGASRFEDLDLNGPRTINRVGYVQRAGDGREWLVLPEAFRSEVCKGLDAKAAVKVLVNAGWITPGNEPGKNTFRWRSPDAGKPIHVYRFNGRVFGD